MFLNICYIYMFLLYVHIYIYSYEYIIKLEHIFTLVQ